MNPFVSDWFAAAFNAVLCTTILPSTCVKGDEVVNLHINGSQTTFHVARRYLEQRYDDRTNDNVHDLLLIATMPGVEGRTEATAAEFRIPGHSGIIVVNSPRNSLEDDFQHRTSPEHRDQSRETKDDRYGLRHVSAVPSFTAEAVFVPANIYWLTKGALDLFVVCGENIFKVDFCTMYYRNRDIIVKVGFPGKMINQWSNIQGRVNRVLKAD